MAVHAAEVVRNHALELLAIVEPDAHPEAAKLGSSRKQLALRAVGIPAEFAHEIHAANLAVGHEHRLGGPRQHLNAIAVLEGPGKHIALENVLPVALYTYLLGGRI